MKINMYTSHPSAFISSTFIDLHEDRNKVASTLRDRGLNVNALDIRPASTQSSRNEILNGIQESDFVILLIADRFGTILKSMTGNDVQSITWWEYENARKMGKPIIAYFKNFDSINPNSHDDRADALYEKKRKLFDRFKKIVTQRHNPAFYTKCDELAGKLDKSLISIYRAGVKDLHSTNSELNSKVSQLEAELSELRSKAFLPSSQIQQPQRGLLGLSDLLGDTPTPKKVGLGSLFKK